ncbi:TOMM precursor leader peptide-binding protein [Hamadaea tsunoensis]|uniref:TOMM precursor leader peptide-binding protein n=1 Tax=Hamadaea tsunoensis TaxID=53368 RepID=UPI0004112DDA|nr:TOMM precursor leader peptide-binding protein [Hamadaea tsunoensis]
MSTDVMSAAPVVADDPTLDLAGLVERQRAAHADGRPFLPVRFKGAAIEIGPLVRPGVPGCVACAEERHRSVASTPPMHAYLAQEPSRLTSETHWSVLAAELVAARLAGGADDDVIQVVSAARGEIQLHRLTPVPDCEVCSVLPDDSADLARWSWTTQRSAEPERLRVKPLLPLSDLAHMHDHRYGPVAHVYRDPIAPMAFTGVELATLRHRPRMYAFGRSRDFESSRRVGFLEAVERESGSWPSARRTSVVGSYRSLADVALDPALLGLTDPAYDGHRHSLLTPYSPDAQTSWVWGHDVASGTPVLVPEHVAYYGVPGRPGRARFLYECSSGCAVGGCLEEAVLYACLETIERDAFLLAWYSQTPGTPLDPGGVVDPDGCDLLDVLAGEGYETRLFDITSDVGVPVVWALALDPANPDGASLSAAAAHPDPERAITGALVEVAAMAVLGNRRTDHPSAEDRRAMLADPTRVVSLDDHVALYTLPASLDRLAWQLEAGPPVDAATHFGDWRSRWIRPDLTDTMRLVTGAMAAAGLPPIIVRQTTARDHRLGVEVVKAIAPGALAMTFGHVHHRTRGLPRLDAARARTGVDGPILPHPFP